MNLLNVIYFQLSGNQNLTSIKEEKLDQEQIDVTG